MANYLTFSALAITLFCAACVRENPERPYHFKAVMPGAADLIFE